MAKGFGPAVAGSFRTSGPAIASFRGGSNLLTGKSGPIRIGGPESGSHFSISPKEAKVSDLRPNSFNNFLKSLVTVTRADQIGVGNVEARNAEKSVRAVDIDPFPNMKKAPMEPEVVSNIIEFPVVRTARVEGVTVRQDRGVINFVESVRPVGIRPDLGTVDKKTVSLDRGREVGLQGDISSEIKKRNFLNYQITLSRIRANLDLVRAIKLQTATVSRPDTAAASKSELKAQSAGENLGDTPVRIVNNLKTENLKSAVKQVRIVQDQRLVPEVDKNEEDVKNRYIAADEEVNADRRRVLVEAYAKLKAQNSGENVDGKRLIEKSEIFAKYLRSRLLFQLGLENQQDGGQEGIAENLAGNSDVVVGDVEKAVDLNTALVRTQIKPRRLAERKELARVFTLPERTLTVVPVEVVEQEIEKVKRGVVEAVRPAEKLVVTPVSKEAEDETGALNEQLLKDVGSFTSRLFDTRVHNIFPEPLESLLRRFV